MTRFTFVAPDLADLVPRGHVPSFSVIVAAYQAADVIDEAIESALGQTLPPLEVIVCDDGSTDDIDGALAPYRDRIVLLRKENGGEASAKNAAARAASGDFVVILDADDVFLPERLEALGELAAIRSSTRCCLSIMSSPRAGSEQSSPTSKGRDSFAGRSATTSSGSSARVARPVEPRDDV